jgi:hypothetical protein
MRSSLFALVLGAQQGRTAAGERTRTAAGANQRWCHGHALIASLKYMFVCDCTPYHSYAAETGTAAVQACTKLQLLCSLLHPANSAVCACSESAQQIASTLLHCFTPLAHSMHAQPHACSMEGCIAHARAFKGSPLSDTPPQPLGSAHWKMRLLLERCSLRLRIASCNVQKQK